LKITGRDLEATKRHLRRGWYGGKGKGQCVRFEKCNVRGCWETAEREMNLWISKDKEHTNGKGVEGELGALVGAERWTNSPPECTSIEDMEGIGSIEELSQDADEEQDLSAEHELNVTIQVGASRLGGQDGGGGAAD